MIPREVAPRQVVCVDVFAGGDFKRFRPKVIVAEAVAPARERVGVLVGEAGTGKTTLVRAALQVAGLDDLDARQYDAVTSAAAPLWPWCHPRAATSPAG